MGLDIRLYDELLSFCKAIWTKTKILLFLMDDLGHPFLFRRILWKKILMKF